MNMPQFNQNEPDQHFWSFNVGHAITIFLLLVTTIGMYFRMDGRLTAVELLAANNYRYIQSVDDKGTNYSKNSEAEMKAQLKQVSDGVLWLMSRYPENPKPRNNP